MSYDWFLDVELLILRSWLDENPPPSEIVPLAAKIFRSHSRSDIPDWVEILANGNPDHLPAVIETALADLREEENHEPG
jgi:hypothetical protein